MDIKRMTVRWLLRAGLLFVLCPATAHAAGSFAYVVVPAPCRQATPCNTWSDVPSVLVYDTATARLVTSIPLPNQIDDATSLVLSRDGTRLYIVGAASSADAVTVVDTTTHLVMGSFSTSSFALGPADIDFDGSTLFVIDPHDHVVRAIDTRTHAAVGTFAIPAGGPVAIAASPISHRIYVATSQFFGPSGLFEYDTTSGAVTPLDTTPNRQRFHLYVSRDGRRLYDTAVATGLSVLAGGDTQIWDTATRALVTRLGGAIPYGAIDALSRRAIYRWRRDGIAVYDYDAFAGTGAIGLANVRAIAITADESAAWVSTFSNGSSGQDALQVIDLASNAIRTVIPLTRTPSDVVTTPPGALGTCSYQIDTHQSSWSVNGGTAAIGSRFFTVQNQ